MDHISFLLLPQALASSITISMEMLSAADTIHSLKQRLRPGQLTLVTVAKSRRPMQVNAGLTLQPAAALSDVNDTHLIFIPALWGNPSAIVRRHPEIVAWIQRQYDNGATFCSVGTGSYFLAEAGLLDDRVATTHWRYFQDFSQRFPRIQLQRKRFITRQDRLYCTGSVNAVRDVMLHFVERIFDNSVADEVSRHFTHELKRSYESLLLQADPFNSHHDELIIKVQEWLHRHYADNVVFSEVAATFGLNSRTFYRRFRQATNQSPKAYLQEIRISQARELLKHSNLAISEIGFAVGYQDSSYFTELYRKRHGVTPNAYRRLVRTKLFNVEESD